MSRGKFCGLMVLWIVIVLGAAGCEAGEMLGQVLPPRPTFTMDLEEQQAIETTIANYKVELSQTPSAPTITQTPTMVKNTAIPPTETPLHIEVTSTLLEIQGSIPGTIPTAMPTEVKEPSKWETVVDEDRWLVEVINKASGERIGITIGDESTAFEWENGYYIWDPKRKEWKEPIRIFSLEELVSQAPSKEEVNEFLNSDIIVRAEDSRRDIVPLGIINSWDGPFGGKWKEVEVIIYDGMKLVYSDIGDGGEVVLVNVIPAIIASGDTGMNDPSYALVLVG